MTGARSTWVAASVAALAAAAALAVPEAAIAGGMTTTFGVDDLAGKVTAVRNALIPILLVFIVIKIGWEGVKLAVLSDTAKDGGDPKKALQSAARGVLWLFGAMFAVELVKLAAVLLERNI